MLILDLSILLLAAGISYAINRYLVKFSHNHECLDYPSPLKRHKYPTPFLGGFGVFLSFWLVVLLGLAAAYFFGGGNIVPDEFRGISTASLTLIPKIAGLFAGGLLILIVGFFDDRDRWQPLQKLAGQIAAALILMGLGFTINLLEPLGVIGFAVTLVWILLLINAFNFIDSLDGHCAGIALIACISFICITQIIGQTLLGVFLCAFAGALIGFLPHNFKPAKIFLGDNGSLFIGYMMAAFTLISRYQAPEITAVTFFIPILVFGVPIYDTVSVLVVRLYRGVPFWKGDRNHFAHRLVKMGMSDRVAVIFSYFIAATLSLIAILTTQVTLTGAVLIGFIFCSILGNIAFLEYYAVRKTLKNEKTALLHRRRKGDVHH